MCDSTAVPSLKQLVKCEHFLNISRESHEFTTAQGLFSERRLATLHHKTSYYYYTRVFRGLTFIDDVSRPLLVNTENTCFKTHRFCETLVWINNLFNLRYEVDTLTFTWYLIHRITSPCHGFNSQFIHFFPHQGCRCQTQQTWTA